MSSMPEPKTRRKTHVKSRSGCRRCKMRRVKCDECTPACGACRKRQELCVYETEKATSPSDAALPLSLPLGDTRIQELALLHHWTAITCESVSYDENRDEMRVSLPQCALSHDYLLNAVFAITAAHLTSLEPESTQKHLLMALQFQSTSLRSFRPTLASISPAESPALYYCSILLGMLTLALRSVETTRQSPIDTLCQLANLWRGTGKIQIVAGLKMDERLAAKSPSEPVRSSEMSTTTEADASRQIQAFLDRLMEAAAKEPGDASKHYSQAIDALKDNVRWAQNGSTVGALRWPPAIPSETIAMIRNREPLAIAVTLLFCALLRGSESIWWMGSFATDLLEELSCHISGKMSLWEDELAWVRSLYSIDA